MEYAMRLEATVPESRGKAVDQLANELGLSRSQMIDEALAIFMQAVSAARQSHRLVTIDRRAINPATVIVTPTLASLEWSARPQDLNISPEALDKVRALLASPPEPGPALRSAAERFKTTRRRRAG
jgi:hypothetical protein